MSLKQSLGAIGHNRPLVLLCLSAVFALTGMFTLRTLQVYYARDVLGNADYQIVLTVVSTGVMFLVSPAIPKIVETFGKKRTYVVAGAVTAVGGAGIALSPPSVPALTFTLFAVYGAGIAAFGIGVGGYVAGAATQSQGAIDAIRYLTGFGPALFVGIAAAIMLAYPLTEDRFQEVVREIAFRRAERKLGAGKPPA